MNYIELKPDIPLKIHITDHYWIKREVKDIETGGMKWIESLVFWVDLLNGEPVSKTFSVLSTKLYALFEPYLAEHKYRNFDFTVSKSGAGFATTFALEAAPHAEVI